MLKRVFAIVLSDRRACTFYTIWRREISYLQAAMYSSVYYKRTSLMTTTLTQNFRRISSTYPKARHVSEHYPKISVEEPMFRWYSNTFKYSLRDYVTIAMIIFSVVKITCYFYVWNTNCNILFSYVKKRLHRKTHLVFH